MIIGLVGSGVMGRGIAQIAVQAGCRVLVFDTRPGAPAEACIEIMKMLDKLVDKGRLSSELRNKARDNLVAVEALAGLAECDVVVEAVVEDLAVKRRLFADLEALVRDDCILATNTSSLSVTSIAAGLHCPQRVAGFHFFNPVPLMKIVEVIDGLLTDPAVSASLLELGQRMGHTSVRAKDTPGFIVNHAGRGYGTEALRILAESVADFPQLDRILRETAGFRLGPFELLDLTALDVSHPVMESIYNQYYQEPRFRPQPLTRQMLAAGLLGRKVGRGFYNYEGGIQEKFDDMPVPAPRPVCVWLPAEAPDALRELVQRLGATLDGGDRPAPDSLCVVTPVGEDATTVARRAQLDAARVVAVETLFDSSKRRVVMTTPATTDQWREAAHSLFGADGVPVSVIRDSAGLVAQRVVATIVNIASDIAQQGIASPADIDRAVTLGLGYPQGPLAWGDRLGASVVLRILEGLQDIYGDPRYRPSPWLKRRAMLGLSLLHEEI